MKPLEDPLPCPFCGSDDLYVGADSCDSECVRCIPCGARIVVYWDSCLPQEISVGDDIAENFKMIKNYYQHKAMTKWNTRT